MRLKINILGCVLLFICSTIYGQIDSYAYKRELKGITDNWHRIMLPDEMFKNVSQDLSDIRIYGITKENDTVEAPYILKQNQKKRSSKQVNFEIINRATTSKGSFVTFKIPSEQAINQIRLFFKEDNFDRLVNLEGSQNLKEWYSIIDEYRILSIKNELTAYSFTSLKLPDSKYQYYRLFIKGTAAPELKNAQITMQETTEGDYKMHAIKSMRTEEKKQNRSTVIDIDLQTAVPVSYIKIEASNNFDYYRSVRIEYLRDSIQTQKEWRYTYQNLSSGILNSIEENEFRCNSTITDKLRVIIDNQDNEPLTISTIQIKGYTYELITRFTTPATYYLTYGNARIGKPSYDLQYMSNIVPEKLKPIGLGTEEGIEKKGVKVVTPLFENKIWLWAVMGVIIALLGGFTLMMMKKK
ncbi:DUF3999 family protein [uncultured Aquimarina sp.]|uniref:DUF3999 family protein n=1 Tax=uncultured Aquimarina sp. TaxID=575652 RepID=UPI00263575B9|nr:DUF3999 family protein [uncultured Aquimarina sp.]